MWLFSFAGSHEHVVVVVGAQSRVGQNVAIFSWRRVLRRDASGLGMSAIKDEGSATPKAKDTRARHSDPIPIRAPSDVTGIRGNCGSRRGRASDGHIGVRDQGRGHSNTEGNAAIEDLGALLRKVALFQSALHPTLRAFAGIGPVAASAGVVVAGVVEVAVLPRQDTCDYVCLGASSGCARAITCANHRRRGPELARAITCAAQAPLSKGHLLLGDGA